MIDRMFAVLTLCTLFAYAVGFVCGRASVWRGRTASYVDAVSRHFASAKDAEIKRLEKALRVIAAGKQSLAANELLEHLQAIARVALNSEAGQE
jgi:hypothetical protein